MERIQNLISLDGRVALITGGGGHIGSTVAAAMAELGADLVLLDHQSERCRKTTSRLRRRFDTTVESVVADLRDEEAVRSVPDRVEASLGRLDILVHSAALTGEAGGSGYAVPFQDQESDAWREALEVNLTSIFNLTQAAAGLLADSSSSSIVNIGSIYGVVGPDPRLYEGLEMGNPAAYAASKGGLLQLTRWLATTLAPEIRVNAVSPGGVRRQQDEEFRRRYEDRTPLGRMAREEDVAAAVIFLASDMSRYVTGQNLMVDGGWTAW